MNDYDRKIMIFFKREYLILYVHMSKVCNAWLLIFELMYLIENSLREITLNILRYATEEHRFSTIEGLLIEK